ncbi:MAG TPA: DUF362 domain-containing protein [Candidatus Deferrimicrobium sp.]|nr:DUF362 domain-containing protein [Candidatus Deferrimicrobium sp.]
MTINTKEHNNPVVAVSHGPEIRQTTRSAIDLLGGMKKFVKKGDKVFIKPNLMSPTQHSITSGDVLFTIVEMCQEAGAADIVIADSPSISLSSRLTFRMLGYDDFAKRMGARYLYLRDFGIEDFEWVEVPEGKSLKKIRLPKELLASDVLISMPVAKTHSVTQVTLAMKLNQGIVCDEDKWESHMVRPEHGKSLLWKFSDLMLTRARPDLTVMDMWYCVQGQGPWISPMPPKADPACRIPLVKKDLILAGTDPIAVDACTAYIMGFDPINEIPLIKDAYERGIGQADVSKINVVGEKLEDHRFDVLRAHLEFEYKNLEPYLRVFKGDVCAGACSMATRFLMDLLRSFGLKFLIESYEKGHPLVLLVGENPPEPPPGTVVGVLGDCAVCSTQHYAFREKKFYKKGWFKKDPAFVDQWGCPPFRIDYGGVKHLVNGLKGAVPLLGVLTDMLDLIEKFNVLIEANEPAKHRWDYDPAFGERYAKEIEEIKKVL